MLGPDQVRAHSHSPIPLLHGLLMMPCSILVYFSSLKVDCLSKILQTNVLSSNATLTNPPDASDKLATPITTPTISKLDIRSSVPYKGLVSGTTVVVTLISTQTNEKDDRERGSDLESSSESSECVFPSLHGGLDSVVVPLVQIQLLNVLCGLCTSTNGGCSYEMSCFNMAVDYCGNKQTMCSKFALSL